MHKPMKILVDRNIPGVNETFARHGEVCKVDGRRLRKEHLLEARALIVRSVTTVNSSLLENTAVEFVGTATIGTDHMDIPWLEQQGIHWASAPGCNADAAAQYTLAMMLLASKRLAFPLTGCSVGIVGHGNVGSRIHWMLRTCGVRDIRVCDPPLQQAGCPDLCTMDEISGCDVVSFHVPLTLSGPYATMGLVDDRFLARLQPGSLLVNTSRGKVTAERSLRNWLISGRGHAALDVWPDEPNIHPGLLTAATVATPHVAGYSLDGKLRGTELVYRQFCEWLGTGPMCPGLLSDLGFYSLPGKFCLTVEDAILAACPVERDDEQLRKLITINPENRSVFFDELRQEYPERRDFTGWQLPAVTPEEVARILRTLGFNPESPLGDTPSLDL
jgi:erythronate-4-phosphate dehydrogenase